MHAFLRQRKHSGTRAYFQLNRKYQSLFNIFFRIFYKNIMKQRDGSVLKSPLNNSSAKAWFSFPRTQKLVIRRPHNNHQIYDLPSVMETRATSLGFGKKVDMHPNINAPSPDRYEKPSDFQRSPKKGTSIGIGRESFKAISIFPNNKNPGPGTYENLKKETSKNYSMRGRDGFPEIIKKSDVPGPGNYEMKDTNQVECFVNSRRKSPKIYSINPLHQNNKENSGRQLGPGKYETNTTSMGKQFLGTKKSYNSFMFMKQMRNTFFVKEKTPGPGSYEHFSEFGP